MPRVTRISAAVPETPMTTIGSQMCFSRSTNFAWLHGAATKSGENSPVIAVPVTVKAMYMMISAMKNPGTDIPRKPMNVNK